MMTGSIGRRLLRFAGVLALAGFTVGCASSQQNAMVAPADFGKDPASRAARLVGYCERLSDKGELVTALGLCARAHEIDPDEPETLMKIASILHKLDRQQAAAQTYKALLDRHPDHYEALYSLGKLYMETGETGLAALHFNQAMHAKPEDPRPYNALGIIRDQAGEHQAAQALYRTALAYDPDNRSLRNNLGLSLALSGQRDEAIEMLAELAVDPDAHETVLRNLEAAYAARAVPPSAPGQAGSPAAPMTPAAASPPPAQPMAQPVKTEVLEPLPGAMDSGKPRPAPKPAPAMPAEGGAPTPLFVPQPSASGDPQQSGAREAEPAEPAEPSSVILAAAERLMAPPEWADFEPGALITAEPPPDKPAGQAPAPQSGGLGEPVVDAPELGAVVRPGADQVSMLLLDNSPARA